MHGSDNGAFPRKYKPVFLHIPAHLGVAVSNVVPGEI